VLVEGIRLLITLALTASGFLAGETLAGLWPEAEIDPRRTAVWGAMLGAGIGYVLGGVAGRRFSRVVGRADELLPSRSAPEILLGGFGLLMGVVIGAVMSVPVVALVPTSIGWPLAGLVVVAASSFGWRLLGGRAPELVAWAGLTPLEGDGLPSPPATVHLLDASAAIDGRFVELVRSGLLQGALSVPGFVVDELQALADAADAGIRRRGRRGLDHLDVVRRMGTGVMTVDEDTVPEAADVDAKLIALALRRQAGIVTTDHNLASAAELRGVGVVNPHAIGERLRLPVAAGDELALTIERPGSEPGQGVGYLDDGTMVVVADAADDVGSTLDVEVANLVTTAVGRLVFARRR
jgi:uncharacterized protein YacL